MINRYEVYETNQMIAEENLDVRTITLGISLLDCIDADLDKLNENIYNRITTVAKDLAALGEKIEHEFFIVVNWVHFRIEAREAVHGTFWFNASHPRDFIEHFPCDIALFI